jgi:hypothetical protein
LTTFSIVPCSLGKKEKKEGEEDAFFCLQEQKASSSLPAS